MSNHISSITKIGIIAALPVEVDNIKKQMQNLEISMVAGSEHYTGRIGNHDIVLMQCGMGKVSAAAGAQALISHHSPQFIINTGCAGALSDALNVGDMVISNATVEWDLDTIELGNPRGYVSAMDCVYMNANSTLVENLYQVIHPHETVYKGLVVSGDQFVSKPEQRELIQKSFPDALCAEMEGAAIGHVCAQNGIPFCVIRCMSDTADGNSGVSFAEFSQLAGEKSANYIIRYLLTK